MSARNGDKSRFNRERKQKIARRKRTHELLERAAKARKSADTTVRASNRVWPRGDRAGAGVAGRGKAPTKFW